MIENIFTYISCLIGFSIIFIYCITIIILKKELPNSISQTVYSLSEKWKWTFTAVMIAVAFMIMPQLMEITDLNYQFLSYFTTVGIIGVGVDPLVKGEKNIIHYISACEGSEFLCHCTCHHRILTIFYFVNLSLHCINKA